MFLRFGDAQATPIERSFRHPGERRPHATDCRANVTNTWREHALRKLDLRVLVPALAPVDISSLCVFRMLFGLTMAAACTRFLVKGWLESQWLEPRLLFPYPGLELLRPLPGPLLQLLMWSLVVLALSIALGLFTRLSCLLFALGFSYLELLDRATYLNHYYLVSCLSVLLACVPAGGRYSLDAKRSAALRVSHAPALLLFALRLQVAVVYLFAGLAKLRPDWLLRAQPLRIWLSAHSDLPLLGQLLAQPETAFLASWLGMLFDLSVVPLLLWQRSRRLAFAALVVFHVSTGLLLPIGMFPWIMLSAATLLLPASWPTRFFPAPVSCPEQSVARVPRWAAALLLVYCSVQVGLPLHRHIAYPEAAWSYRGFNFAWKVMIAEKAGHVRLRVHNPRTGQTRQVDNRRYLTALQERAVVADPELIAALARHVAQEARAKRGDAVAVYVDAFASLNGRPSARLVDPDIDVSENAPERWLLPLLE